MVYPIWTTLAPHPAARSPLSLSFSHLLIPCLLSCFPTLREREGSPPLFPHNSWIPSPAPSWHSTLNTPGIHGIVYVLEFSYCLSAFVITGRQGSLLLHLLHLRSDPKMWGQTLPIFAFNQDILFFSGLKDAHSSAASHCVQYKQHVCMCLMSHGPSLVAHFSTCFIQDTSAD